MKVSQVLAATSALVASAAAGPIAKREVAYTDAGILNYALTLEHLEDKFYRDGLAKFTESDFYDAGYDYEYYQNIKEVSYDETTHVSFLTSALTAAGATPVKECVYKFGYTDVESFLATASVLEGVGVTAYLGAAAKIANKDYLTAAGSILTVEARHNAYIRAGLDQAPFAQAFDVPLDFNQVYSLAAPFIVSCPEDNPPFLALKAFPALTATTDDDSPVTGDELKITTDVAITESTYFAFVTVTGPVFAEAKMKKGCYYITIPAGVHGQSYLVLTNSKTAVNDDTTLAGPAVVEIFGTDGKPHAD